ncbi:MAG TPA: urea ABC transporter permease subunit UrtB [Verrucomicrobium sp.]|nr:urea ABC transporter permease subunit UrtB [Verrucomicrobium sp.]
MPFRTTFACALLMLGISLTGHSARAAEAAAPTEASIRATVVEALTKEDSAAQAVVIRTLALNGGPMAVELLTLWKEGGIYLYEDEADPGKITPVTLTGEKDADGKQAALLLLDKSPLKDATGKAILIDPAEVSGADTDSNIRRAIKDVTDMSALLDPDENVRLKAVSNVGLEQNVEKLPALQARAEVETSSAVKRALSEAISLAQLKVPDDATKIGACLALGKLGSIPSQDALKTVAAEANKEGKKDVAAAAEKALGEIATHLTFVNTASTMFRGLSTGSILLVVAIGLAITFGLMGVINMAHGELLVVGAYTTYVVQCIFGAGLTLSPFSQFTFTIPGMHTSGGTYSTYFLVALPCSFLMAAMVGIALERGIIRFLYKRPLESLLATWGVSIVMQQLLRLIFGPQNVALESPSWLSGSWVVNDVSFGWNRLFVIGFAVMIIFMTWLVLNKTPLGLLIRSVMQNREMAACMGVRTERVNMMTFGFGSGLAGLAGAFISQIDNVGPYTGQSYIVDSFMTVVVGGVGNIIGTVISALGIGVVDQSLQQILGNPVLGKILVLVTIILFLQWRPQGLFVTRSRSLES